MKIISDATISNADMDDASAGDYIRIKLMRDVSDGTSTTGDCRVFWVSLYEA
jgi:hypothetical protein